MNNIDLNPQENSNSFVDKSVEEEKIFKLKQLLTLKEAEIEQKNHEIETLKSELSAQSSSELEKIEKYETLLSILCEIIRI